MNLVNFPFSPSKTPFFYGWIIIACSVFGCVMSIPGQTMGLSVFTDDLIASLGLTRVQLSIAYMIGTIASSLILPFAGRQIDRFGARAIGAFSCFALGIFLVLLGSSVHFLSYFSGSETLRLFLAIALVTFAFLGLRHFGQGVLTVASRNLIGKWFNKKRGKAVAISGVFVSLGFGASPMLLNGFVEAYGWTKALFILAAIVGIGAAIIVAIFFRDNPEECGLAQDGEDSKEDQKEEEGFVEFTAKEARRTLPFWAFNFGLSVQAFVITAVTFHVAYIGRTFGIDRETIFSLFIPISIASTVMNILAGYLSDRIKVKYLLVFQMIGILTALIGATFLDQASGQILLVVGLGSSTGMFGCLTIVVWPRFFGRKHLGEISGYSMGWMVFSSAIAPYVFSLSVFHTGDYKAALIASAFLPILVLTLASKANNPQKSVG